MMVMKITTMNKMAYINSSMSQRRRACSSSLTRVLLLSLLILFSSFSTTTASTTTTTSTTAFKDEYSSSSSSSRILLSDDDDDFRQPECLTAPTSVFISSVKLTIEEVRKLVSLISKLFGSYNSSLISHNFRLSNAITDCLDLLDLSAEELSWTLSSVARPAPPPSSPPHNINPNNINVDNHHVGIGKPIWTGKGGNNHKYRLPPRSRLLADDLRSWLSAALGNQDTCIEGFENIKTSFIRHLIEGGLNHVTSLVSDVLAMVRHEQHHKPGASSFSSGGHGGESTLSNSNKVPVRSTSQHRHKFPSWMHTRDRRLLQLQVPPPPPPPMINNNGTSTNGTSNNNGTRIGGGGAAPTLNVDVVVAADGSGNFTKIMDAVLAAPDKSDRRFVIYIKRGVYIENVDIKKKKWNLMMVGDGMDATVISGNRSFIDGWTTFRSATFAVAGRGFIARDLTIENTAGAVKHQAVALRSDSDLSAYYRCAIRGYQDTLYAHSLRQFYRDCLITGTVDFIFGNGAVVFQNCQILARKPLPDQKNSITAQGRKDPNQNTGFSIQFSNISADSDLLQALANSSTTNSSTTRTQTYLGRPWKLYSRTVFMQSYIGSVIRPEGWLEWMGNFALDTLYYGEYMNYGPGAGLGGRVKWPGYHAINESSQANNFTVAQFIDGTSWLPSTGVKFTAGLVV